MTTNSYAIVENGVVDNIVVWDGEAEWSPPAGTTAVQVPATATVDIGYSWDGKNFTKPASPTPEQAGS